MFVVNSSEKISIENYEQSKMTNVIVPTYPFYTKLNTQVFYGIDKFIAEELRQECKDALFFIGHCAEVIPQSRRKFTDISKWNDGKFQYAKRRFGYVPGDPNPPFGKLMEITFSPTGVNQIFACSSEFMIFLYYVFKSLEKTMDFSSKSASGEFLQQAMSIKLISGIVQYAANAMEKMNESTVDDSSMKFANFSAESKARYLWELHTAFSMMSGIVGRAGERIYCLPQFHTFQSTMFFSDVAEFGTYKIEGSLLHQFPRTATLLPSCEKVMFHVPHDSKVRDACTEVMNEVFADFVPTTLQETLRKLMKLNTYKSQFLAVNKAAITSNTYNHFETIDEAIDYVKKAEIPPVEGFKIYCILKVKVAEDNYNLELIEKN